MNVYEVRVDGVTKKVTADHYAEEHPDGTLRLRFYRIINDPNSTDKAKLVAEFTHYDYVTLESEGLNLKDNNLPGRNPFGTYWTGAASTDYKFPPK